MIVSTGAIFIIFAILLPSLLSANSKLYLYYVLKIDEEFDEKGVTGWKLDPNNPLGDDGQQHEFGIGVVNEKCNLTWKAQQPNGGWNEYTWVLLPVNEPIEIKGIKRRTIILPTNENAFNLHTELGLWLPPGFNLASDVQVIIDQYSY